MQASPDLCCWCRSDVMCVLWRQNYNPARNFTRSFPGDKWRYPACTILWESRRIGRIMEKRRMILKKILLVTIVWHIQSYTQKKNQEDILKTERLDTFWTKSWRRQQRRRRRRQRQTDIWSHPISPGSMSSGANYPGAIWFNDYVNLQQKKEKCYGFKISLFVC